MNTNNSKGEVLRAMAAAPEVGRPGEVLLETLPAILSRVQTAKAAGARLLVLPELCVTSASLGSLYLQPLLIQKAQEAAEAIRKASGDCLVVFGLPVMVQGVPVSAALAVRQGAYLGIWLKTQKEPFDSPALGLCPPGLRAVPFAGEQLPLKNGTPLLFNDGRDSLCVWIGSAASAGKHLAEDGLPNCSALAVLASEPSLAGQPQRRALALSKLSADRLVVYSNAGANESSTDYVFDGQGLILYQGQLLAQTPPFSNDVALTKPGAGVPLPPVALPPDAQAPYAPPPGPAQAAWCREALEIAARGLALRLARIKIRTALLGVSGGLDSAMALVITKRAFEINGYLQEGILAYSLPGPGTSTHTRENARRLMQALDLLPREIEISKSVRQHFKDIDHQGQTDAAFENAQARERTQILMDLANLHGGIMVGSGDLSELALGFTTFGGDHMSMYGVNGGLYKSAIRLILWQVAEDCDSAALKEVLTSILQTPISPELLPPKAGQIQQKTEDILGPYPLIDLMLHHFLQDHLPPRALYQKALSAFSQTFESGLILSTMKNLFSRFFANQFKRNCLPDGPQVLSVSLSPRGGFALPSDAASALWLSELALLEQEMKVDAPKTKQRGEP